jgi:hypothetical protein
MSSGIILTQIAGPCRAEALAALAVHGARGIRYGPDGWTQESALVQHFEHDLEAVALPVSPLMIEGAPITRFVAKLLSDTGPSAETAPTMMMIAFDVPLDAAQEVDQWYAEEHIPMLMRAPGWLRARRYESFQCVGTRHYTSIALHDLRNLEVLDSRERALARATPWRARLEQTDWFQKAGRFVYRCIDPAV